MSRIDDVFAELGFAVDPAWLDRALPHSSYAYENGRVPDNERLEFLGDAVLELVVTEHLYHTFSDAEGRLAKLRAAVVNSQVLADVARSLELGPELRLGKGEIATGGTNKNSLLANAMEAVIGAVFLSAGQVAAGRLIHHLLDGLIARAAASGAGLDWKTSLQELTAHRELGVPAYDISESGPDHNKHFVAVVRLGDWTSEPGEGSSKKQAEQGAAERAFHALDGELAADGSVRVA
ncbi:MAG: ribonuclease III [Propionibacteriaceae bacterium]|jgi:ribonuclease-3|nr:ribonuclease III [Propionibacteriaceae bacterium]